MRIVFDVDNTICVHTNRDYVNASPVYPMIDKINKLHGQGVEIWLYTSRGQNSCNGDLALIIERNEAILVDWLERHGVCYDKLLFGKPLADFYVDDGAMSIKEFMKSDFEVLKGNSNSQVLRLGDIVIKTTHNARYQYDWYNEFESLGIVSVDVPQDRLITLNTLKMERIEGRLLCEDFDYVSFALLLGAILRFSKFPTQDCDFDGYLKSCASCYCSDEYNSVLAKLAEAKDYVLANTSFCHGDLSLNNVLVREHLNRLVLIDPNKRECSSWLFDLAKLRCSFDGLDEILGYEVGGVPLEVDVFDAVVSSHFKCDMYVLKLLEITRFARILPYMRKMGKIEAEAKIVDKIGELCAKITV